MKKFWIWLLALVCLMGVAQAEEFIGEWKMIGWMEYGEFEPDTDLSSERMYTFGENGRMTYSDGGSQRPGIWEEKSGVTYRGMNGRKDRMTLRADGTLLVGSWSRGEVFSRDGRLPQLSQIAAGKTEDGLVFEPVGDGSLKIVGYEIDNEEDEYDENGQLINPVHVVIPAKINGVPVSMVGERAFATNRRIASVTVEEGVRYVGREAFSECVNVASIVLPESVTALEGYCFSDCRKVEEVALPRGLQDLTMNPFARCAALRRLTVAEDHLWLEVADGALIHKQGKELKAFPANADATGYTVPDSVSSIEVAAFMGCAGLEHVILNDKLKEIGSLAFENSGLKEITIPAGVEELNSNPFTACYDLEKVVIEEGNPAYYSVDGVLFAREDNALIYYPMGKTDTTYTIPGSTRVVDFDAFLRQPHLTTIVLEEGVEVISPYAFYGMKNLQSITLPETLTALGGYAFCECQNLREIEIPASVPAIEDYTFAYGGLTKLIVKEGTPIAETAFEHAREEVVIEYK